MTVEPGKVIYEVNLCVSADVAQAYHAWLKEHIQEMLTLPGFLAATLYKRRAQDEVTSNLVPNAESAADSLHEPVLFTALYTLQNRAALERYFAEDAPRMRQQGLERWAGKFTASRRILELDTEFAKCDTE